MSRGEFVNASMRDLFVTTCAMTMGGFTQSLIGVPIFGFMLGSFVGSVAGHFIYERGYNAEGCYYVWYANSEEPNTQRTNRGKERSIYRYSLSSGNVA